jgi:protein-S-isoprenylcysteine O-methyltransferase Ste14
MYTSPLIILLAMALYGVVHSILASRWAKNLAQTWYGVISDRVYRLGYNIFAIVSLLPVLALVPGLDDRTLYTIPFPWAFLTLLGQVVAVALLVVGLLQTGVWTFLGVRQLLGEGDEHEGEMIVHGLYRWVRHPLYTAGLLFIWLTPVMSINLLALNIGLTVYLVIGAIIEERKLLQAFGPAYAEYQQETPMLVPALRLPRR